MLDGLFTLTTKGARSRAELSHRQAHGDEAIHAEETIENSAVLLFQLAKGAGEAS